MLSQLQASSSPPTKTTNGISSPVLAALGTLPVTNDPIPPPQTTTDWAKDIPFGSSPPGGHSNGVSVAGSPSKPLQPNAELRGGFHHASPPTSPSAAFRQLAPRNNGYQSFGYLGTSPGRARPVSMHSQHSQQPPLPHQPQAHYYGAPQIDFGLSNSNKEDHKADDVSCCLLDSLASAGEEGSRTTENVLLVGHEHGLDVHGVDKSHFSRIGSLGGLRGTVIGAKIIPSTMRDDPVRSSRPLIAIIVHGPCAPSESDVRSPSGANHDEDDLFDPSNSMLQALDSADTAGPGVATHYQTTVEVFSLKRGEYVATLFRGPKQPVEISRIDYRPIKPLPDENLSIQAHGRFIIISSGTSGEVFIFQSNTNTADTLTCTFQCIGKVWTKTSHRKPRSSSISSNSSERGSLHDQSPTRFDRPSSAIVSLSHRWLAILPPTASSQSTLHGIVDAKAPSSKPPGLTSHAPAAEPQVNCELDTPNPESVINKVVRDATQESIKIAKWVGGQGLQVWNNYWKPPEQSAQTNPNSFPRSTTMPQMHQAFPPTHAHEEISARTSNRPALVSIIDLEKLSENQYSKPAIALQPIATFSLPNGCSLVSFIPNGLGLLTASAKGDVQHIWDLMRVVHGGPNITSSGDQNISGRTLHNGSSVRQIACYSRLTEARSVDVAWTEPRGERFALVTERGTVHVHDLPLSAFQWPPSRRVMQARAGPNTPNVADHDLDHTLRPRSSSSNTFSGALDMVAGKTQPLLANFRGRPASNPFSGFGGLSFTAGAGVKGSKVVAASFNKSVGAAAGTVNTIRHRGENRLTLPGMSQKIVPGCIRWLGGKNHGHLAVTGGDLVRIYPVQQSSIEKGGHRGPSVVGRKPIEYGVPTATGGSVEHASRNRSTLDHNANQSTTSPHGYWLSPASGHDPKASKNNPHPLSCAEIETNAPYQPFHTDRRINFYVYNNETNTGMHHLHDASPWAFGEYIAATKANVSMAVHDTDADVYQAGAGPMENLISYEGNEEEGQQVVVTTRRRRGKKGDVAEGDDGEFFEDDCEVVDFAESRV